ncbi:MAG: Uncharacterised protein [Opitutia bacterium UBA7350]|nr:MAG: Uncharacterised protein [Opitutae bacterium UBA7350]
MFNLYFSEGRPEKINGKVTGRWLASLRIMVSTYPSSLNHAEKRDQVQADAIIVFHEASYYQDAIKRTFRWMTNRLHLSEDQTLMLSLMN